MLGQEVHNTMRVVVVAEQGLNSMTVVVVVRSMKVVLVVQLVEPCKPVLELVGQHRPALAKVPVLVLERVALELVLALAPVEVPQARNNHRRVGSKWASNHHRRVHCKVLEQQQEPQLGQEQEQVW